MNGIVAFIHARLAELDPRLAVETRELHEGVYTILNEFEARDQDVDLMLGPETQRQQEWNGLWLAVRLLAAEWSDHAEYRKEWQRS